MGNTTPAPTYTWGIWLVLTLAVLLAPLTALLVLASSGEQGSLVDFLLSRGVVAGGIAMVIARLCRCTAGLTTIVVVLAAALPIAELFAVLSLFPDPS